MNAPKRLLTGLLVVVVGFLAAPLTAAADNGDGESDDDDNTVEGTVEETIVIDGDVIEGGGGTRTVSVPAKCWWSEFETEEQFLLWWSTLNYYFPISAFFLPSEEYVQEKLEESKNTPGSWYHAECSEDAATEDYETFFRACDGMDNCIALLGAWYADSEGEPPVVIQPEELALAVRGLLEIPNPEVDQNPKMEGTENTTFVNLDTAFWVTDPDAIGGEDGEHVVRATVPETGLWVEVSARTDGLTIASDAGSTSCSAAEAVTQWSPGEEPACSVEFQRASTGYPNGFPVSVSAGWETEWRGGFGDAETEGGPLDPITTDETANIPVAEVQTFVGGRG